MGDIIDIIAILAVINWIWGWTDMTFTKESHEGYWESHIFEVLDEQGDWHKALIINEPRDYVEVVNGKKFILSETRIRITPIV